MRRLPALILRFEVVQADGCGFAIPQPPGNDPPGPGAIAGIALDRGGDPGFRLGLTQHAASDIPTEQPTGFEPLLVTDAVNTGVQEPNRRRKSLLSVALAAIGGDGGSGWTLRWRGRSRRLRRYHKRDRLRIPI